MLIIFWKHFDCKVIHLLREFLNKYLLKVFLESYYNLFKLMSLNSKHFKILKNNLLD